MIRLFTGFDPREAVGWHAFAQSVVEQTRELVQIIPLGSGGNERDGSNAFTYSRFLVPYLCDFQGFALFVDASDMLVRGDLAELWAQREGWFAAKVVKHDYRTAHPRKYVGTEMEVANADYPRKNWSSVILWNCGHYLNRILTPLYVSDQPGAYLHRFGWLPEERLGELPREWNWLADEYGVNEQAKLVHWTAGIPGFKHYRDAPHAGEWRAAMGRAQRGLQTHSVSEG